MTQLESQWIVGFVDGEGCFFIGLNKNPESTLGFQVLPEFCVVQHKRDEQLLYALKQFFECGVVRKTSGDCYCYRVRGITHLNHIIIPFFEKHTLKTKKNIDFLKFRKVLQLMEAGEHLTVDGLLKIDALRLQMNTRRSRKRLMLIDDSLQWIDI